MTKGIKKPSLLETRCLMARGQNGPKVETPAPCKCVGNRLFWVPPIMIVRRFRPLGEYNAKYHSAWGLLLGGNVRPPPPGGVHETCGSYQKSCPDHRLESKYRCQESPRGDVNWYSQLRWQVHTADRFLNASPTGRFKSSYTPPLIRVITSTASKTL